MKTIVKMIVVVSALSSLAMAAEVDRRENRQQERIGQGVESGQLTPHETRLLKLLVDGHSYKSAAKELRVSVHAISFHMRSIYDKLQVHSKSEAVSKAFRHRLIR